tara:strand:+ start:587 stop:751 length:165 start_codon:yes stop_codon:yes gene_type:complete
MSDNNEEPISRLNSIKRVAAAYKSMYEPTPEPEVKTEEEIETKTEEDNDGNSST